MFNISAYDEKAIHNIFENELFDKGSLSYVTFSMAPRNLKCSWHRRPAAPYRCKFEIRQGLEKTMQQILIR